MTEYKATRITQQFEKTFDDGNTSYSFKTEATGDNWIRANKNRYPGIVEKGNIVDLVTSEGQKRGSQVKTIYCDSVVLSAGQQSQSKDFGGGFKAPPQKAEQSYGASTQACIHYQSSRKDAIEYLKLVVGSNAVKLPEAPAKRLKVLDALLDSFVAGFYTDIETLGAVKRISQEDEAVPEEAAKGDDDNDD